MNRALEGSGAAVRVRRESYVVETHTVESMRRRIPVPRAAFDAAQNDAVHSFHGSFSLFRGSAGAKEQPEPIAHDMAREARIRP
jgi:hypothetical protein